MGSPADTGIDLPTFARFLGQSRLVRAEDVPGLIAGQKTATEAADRLVAVGTLTRFQATKLLAGRWQGLVLGPFRIQHPVGRGGMGLVYLAHREGSGRPLALKILPPRKAEAEPRSLARFKREMRIGRTVPPHPNVVATVDSGLIDGVHFLAMEYVAGPTLKQKVKKNGALSSETAGRLFTMAAEGLAAIHSVGVVHRDVSPGNLILAPGGGLKILDFGVALVTGEPLPSDKTVAGGAGYTMGTMDYIAPEQLRDASTATAASDLYALGCSLYFALAGTPPYPGGNLKQKIRWHKRAEAPPVRAINPGVPEELSALVGRLMAKSPADRPDSAADVALELKSIFPTGESPPLKAPSNPDLGWAADADLVETTDDWVLPVRSSNRTVWLLIAFFSVVLAGLVGLLFVLVIRR